MWQAEMIYYSSSSQEISRVHYGTSIQNLSGTLTASPKIYLETQKSLIQVLS